MGRLERLGGDCQRGRQHRTLLLNVERTYQSLLGESTLPSVLSARSNLSIEGGRGQCIPVYGQRHEI